MTQQIPSLQGVRAKMYRWWLPFLCTYFLSYGQSLTHEREIDSLIASMTLEEKIGMIKSSGAFTNGGVPRLGIPELVMSDGPHGVRHEHTRDWNLNNTVDYKVSFLPAEINLASTWNAELGYQYGALLGREALSRGKDIMLGPGVNIMRSPLNGRNFEYFSEDPYLASVMGVQYIKGVQAQGISACVKHYLANNQETKRQEVSVEMSERALREIYLPAFKAAVENGNVYTIMGAYNKFRGQYCTHHEYLINTILKKEMGFKGAVISDWSAVQNTTQALYFGTDIEMGTEMRNWGKWNFNAAFMGDTALQLIRAGKVPESLVDEKVRRILRVAYQINAMDKSKRAKGERNTLRHQGTALQIAEESIVLLKNQQGLLPLSPTSKGKILIVGDNAVALHAEGGGSAQVPAFYEISPLAGIKKFLQKDSSRISFCQGYKVSKEGTSDDKLIQEAVRAASTAETVIYIGGFNHGYSSSWNDKAFDSEGTDKADLQLPYGQDKLIQALLKANPRTVILLYGGSAGDVSAWEKNCPALLQVGYPGMEAGTAIANILFGKSNPSGKLPFTFPVYLQDIPAHKLGEFPGDSVVRYNEGIFVGYRYFDTYKVTPQFAFGHGLSYTTFAFSDLSVNSKNNTHIVTLKVKNTGSRDGAEVVQVYVSDLKSELPRPIKELKGFQKVFLKAGESKDVTVVLEESAFQYYHDGKKSWVKEPGTFSILAGNSSDTILLKQNIELP